MIFVCLSHSLLACVFFSRFFHFLTATEQEIFVVVERPGSELHGLGATKMDLSAAIVLGSKIEKGIRFYCGPNNLKPKIFIFIIEHC